MRAKLPDRERHRAEKRAGIVLLCRNALLVGNDVFGRADEILGGTDEANDREDPEGHEQYVASCRAIGEASVKVTGQRFGNIGTGAAATAAARRTARALLNNLRLQNDRIDRLNHGDRDVLRMPCGHQRRAIIIRAVGITAENAHTAFASVQDHALLYDGDPLKLLRSSLSETGLKADLHEKADGDGIEAAIERHGVDADIDPRNARPLYPNRAGALDHAVTEIGQINAHVFIAVSVLARVEDAVGLNADHFPPSSGAASGESVVGHNLTSL